MRKQADALKVCPIPDGCLLVMAQRPSRLLGLPETRSLIFLIKNSSDQAEGYLDYYLQPVLKCICLSAHYRFIKFVLDVATFIVVTVSEIDHELKEGGPIIEIWHYLIACMHCSQQLELPFLSAPTCLA
jgi:hypothetical protein